MERAREHQSQRARWRAAHAADGEEGGEMAAEGMGCWRGWIQDHEGAGAAPPGRERKRPRPRHWVGWIQAGASAGSSGPTLQLS